MRGRVPLDPVLGRRVDVPDVPGREDAGPGREVGEAPVLPGAGERGGDFLAGDQARTAGPAGPALLLPRRLDIPRISR
ncbi:hypothetical protein OHQ89_42545 [Streptomyces canus]|uniref:hypothetical protein n=1 Tax=Streptomyces canus TaxID=58343 RepID=UPI0030E24D81